VDSFCHTGALDMPGYDCPVIMAAGAFIQGSSIELSADAPIKSPYTAYMQGGLVFEHVKLGIMVAIQKMLEKGIIKSNAGRWIKMPEENKKKINGKVKLGGLLIALFLLLYIPSFIFWIYGKNIHTDIIRMGELEDYVTTDAYIVRDETVINSPSDGISIRNVEEGEKVGVGDTIATVLNKSSEKLLEDLKDFLT